MSYSFLIWKCSAIESVSGLPCREPGKPRESLSDHSQAGLGLPGSSSSSWLTGMQTLSTKTHPEGFMALTELLGVTPNQHSGCPGDPVTAVCWNDAPSVTSGSNWNMLGVCPTLNKSIWGSRSCLITGKDLRPFLAAPASSLGHGLLQPPKPWAALRSPHWLGNSLSPIYPIFALFVSETTTDTQDEFMALRSNWSWLVSHSSRTSKLLWNLSREKGFIIPRQSVTGLYFSVTSSVVSLLH